MPSLSEVNVWDDGRARTALLRCCGSTRWVEGMLAARPFGSLEALQAASDVVWRDLGPGDFREAFAHHPRIGAAPGAAVGGGAGADTGDGASAEWSRQEQRGVQDASAETRAALARGNEEYERRFGWLFLVC